MSVNVDKPEIQAEVYTFLTKFPSLSINDSKKIRCSLTGHEMPCRLPVLESYTAGKKFQKAREKHDDQFEKYKPHIVPSNKKGKVHQLFCTLTLRHINRLPAHVERHVTGRRYQRALARFEECQRLGTKFKPLSRTKRKESDGSDSEQVKKYSKFADSDTSESDSESVDSMSDLYPREEFERLQEGPKEAESDDDEDDDEDDDDDDFEMEYMDSGNQEVNGVPSSSEVKQGQKRKRKFQSGSKTKVPKQHRGPKVPIQKAFAKKRPIKQPRKTTR